MGEGGGRGFSQGPRRPLDPGLIFLILSIQRLHSCCGPLTGLGRTRDFNICTPVASLPGAWCYRVSTGTGWPGVSVL